MSVKNNSDSDKRVVSGLKQSLAILAGIGSVGLVGCTQAEKAEEASKSADEGAKIMVSKAEEPKGPIVNDRTNWTRIEVKLTDGQIAELARQGIKTDSLKITTYDVSRFAGEMNN